MLNCLLRIGCLLSLLQCLQGFRYVVTTYTGDRFGAGTDARVYLTIFGEKGVSPEKELESSGRDNFERGQLDTFVLDTKDLGRIKKVNIRHDNSWLGPGWFLHKVTVTSEDGDYYEFPCNKWLDKHLDDGRTSRELIPRPIKRKKVEEPEPRQPLECSWPLGVSNFKIPDAQISASTSFNDMHLPFHGRLGHIVPGSLGGWCPYRDGNEEHLEIDLGGIKRITGVATQGMGLVDEWTTAYRISFTNDTAIKWTLMNDASKEPKDFIGNDDQNGTVQHWLPAPFSARFIRIQPIEWHGKGCLRAELYGCDVSPVDANKNSDTSGSLQVSSITPIRETNVVSAPVVSEGRPPQQMAGSIDSGGTARALSTVLEQKMTDSNGEPTTVDVIPVAHLDFDEIRDTAIPDVSGHHNDAHLRKPADIVTFSKGCQRGLRLNGGDVSFDGEFFVDKPKEEITVAAWVKLFSNGGQHSVFDTVGGKDSTHRRGQYHFEVDRGHLRWFHRNEAGDTVFNISTGLMVPSHIWTHCAASYDSVTGKVAAFVNGKLGAQGNGIGELSQDWSGRAGIGRHKGQRILNGEIDEFYIFSKALSPTKIELLMKRCSFETDCQIALGMQSKEIQDSQITASSTYNLHKPFYGRINLASFWGDPARTAWCATKDDKNPYMEIDLKETKSLTGVATQGLSIFDNWVTSFLFCYSENRGAWNCYKERGYDKIFEGNTDKNTIKRHYFHHTVNGRYVRIRPQSWYGNHLCMRAEVYGCTMDLLQDPFDSFGNLPNLIEESEAQTRGEILAKESCNNPLGVANGEVDDLHLTASSSLDSEEHVPFYGRLIRESMDAADIRGCWCAHNVNLRQYIQADLGEVKTITGVATQGYVSHDNWVASYRLGYSDDSGPLEWYRENDDERIFVGNVDRTGIVKHYLKEPIQARYVRINPRAWHGVHICLRFEVFGCKEDGGRKHYSAPKGTLHYSPSALKKHNSNRKELVPSREHPVKGHHKHDVPKQTPKVPMNIAHPHVHIHEQPIAVRLKQQVEKHAQKVNTKPHNIIKPIQSHAYYNKNIRINSFRPEIIVKGGNRVTMPIRVNQNPPNLSGRRNITAIAMFNKPANRISGLPGSQINLIKPRQQSRLQSRLPLGIQPGRPAPHSKPANHQIAQGRLLQSLGAGMRELGINPISFNRAGGSFNKPINAAGILSQFPELIRNGMNEETLRRLNEHVPNLESKIYAHFASRNKKPALYHNPMHHDLATSNIAFMKNYQNHVLSKQNFGLTNHRPLERAGPLESLVPYSNNIPKNLPPSYFTKGSSGSTNELTSQDINDIASLTAQAKQSSDNSGLLSTAERFLSSTDGLLRNSLLSSSRLNTNVAPYLNERDTGALPSLNRPSSSSPYRLPGSAQQGFMHQPTKTFSYLNNMAQNGLPSYPYYPFNQRTSMMENQSMSRQGFPQQLNNQYNQISYFSPPMYTHSWSEYSPCSVTCGPGARKRHRRCGIPDCPSGGVQIESIPCFARSCTAAETPQYSWSTYSPCSSSCGVGQSVRYRLCNSPTCTRGYETETISCYKPGCPICLLDFEAVEGDVIIDQSGLGNNAYLEKHATVKAHDDMCGHFADLSGDGDVILVDRTFRGKPRTGITITCWVNLRGSVYGKHSIFSTVRMVSPTNFIGGYHFEVVDGKVRWFHRNEREKTVFSVITDPVIQSRVWMHYAVTYDAYKGIAKIFVDGKERSTTLGDGMLSQDWGYKAAIGHYDFDDRRLNGWIDEFTMFDYPLKEDQVFQLIGKLRCSANTTEISGVTQSQLDAFKYQGFTMKRHAPETNTEDIKGQISGGIKQRLKRIKKVPKIVI